MNYNRNELNKMLQHANYQSFAMFQEDRKLWEEQIIKIKAELVKWKNMTEYKLICKEDKASIVIDSRLLDFFSFHHYTIHSKLMRDFKIELIEEWWNMLKYIKIKADYEEFMRLIKNYEQTFRSRKDNIILIREAINRFDK